MSVPVVDLDAVDVVEQMLHAYGTVGFASLVGHGIDDSLRRDVFAASSAFHALPLEQKMAIELDANHRGYIPIDTSTDRTSTLAVVTKPNQSASFMMMRDDGPDSPDVLAGRFLAGGNQWPELAGFRPVLERYHEAMCDLGQRLVRLFARGLGDDEGVLERSFRPPTTWLRLLHYPPVPGDAPPDLYGSAPHNDFGFITILAQDEVGGLQVRDSDGAWIDVPPRSDAFVMNVGDMLHRWSNGRLLSTPHRVHNRSGRERYSVPFFFDPHVSTVVAPLSCCIDDEHPAQYEPIEFEAFLRHELTTSYDRHREDHP